MLDKKKYNFNDPLDVGIFFSIMLSRRFLSITDEFKYKKTRYIELSEIYCKDLLKGTPLFKEENKTLKKKRI